MSQHQAYDIPEVQVEPDDDDDLVAIAPSAPLSSAQEKGKGRALSPRPDVTGKIGSSSNAASSNQGRGHRQNIGGVAIETRYGSASTLDEPLSATLVRLVFLPGGTLVLTME